MSSGQWRSRVDARLQGKTPPPSAMAKEEPAAAPRRVAPTPSARPQTPPPAPARSEAAAPSRPAAPPSRAPLLPPTVEPPAGPAASALDEFHPRSLRAYVLAGCFVWGLLLGFLYHVSRDDLIIPQGEEAVSEINNTGGTVMEDPITPLIHNQNRKKGASEEASKPIPVDSQELASNKLFEGVQNKISEIEKHTAETGETRRRYILPKTVYGGPNGRNAPPSGILAAPGGPAALALPAPDVRRSGPEPEPGF